MADHIYALFPTYLPTGRLVTAGKHVKKRFWFRNSLTLKKHILKQENPNNTKINGEQGTNYLVAKNWTNILRKPERISMKIVKSSAINLQSKSTMN